MILHMSGDGSLTWGAPHLIASPGSGQWDAQIEVDPVDGQTVYAAWLQNNRATIAVARSTDFGATWSVASVSPANAFIDKPILAVRGPDVYVAYSRKVDSWVAASHDGGQTFASHQMNEQTRNG